MNKNTAMRPGGAFAALLAALVLLGCGGGGASLPYPDRQFGVTEPQLLDTSNNPNGIVVGRGSGMVVLRIEPAGGAPAPLVGDSAGIGVDTLWFDVDYAGTVRVDLTGSGQSVVSQVEILRDAQDVVPLLTANAGTPKASVMLAPGRYLLRFTATTGATEVMPGLVWFGGTSKAFSLADLQKVTSGSCSGCNLRGANLAGVSLRTSMLTNSDLREAILVRGSLVLGGTDVMAILLGGNAVLGADLSSSTLSNVKLDGAYMTAPLSPAQLTSATLSYVSVTDVFLAGANLTSATLSDSDFSRSVLTRAKLVSAVLSNTLFVHADLSGANLSNATISNSDFTDANLSGADLRNATLSNPNLTRANLSRAIWSNGHVCADPSVGACL